MKSQNVPQINKVMVDWVPSIKNPYRQYQEMLVSEDGTYKPTGRTVCFKDVTDWQQVGDFLDSLTLNGYTEGLNTFARDLDFYVNEVKVDIDTFINDAEALIDRKIGLANLISPPSIRVEDTTIIFNDIPEWAPKNGGIISFVMSQKMALATHVQIGVNKYPLFTTNQEQVRDLKVGVAYSFTFGNGSFFINKGSGSGVVEVGGILVTDQDFSHDDRYASLPYTLSDARLTELTSRYSLNTTFNYPTPKAPYKAYLKVMTSPLPDGESFTPNDGSFNDWSINTVYWFQGNAPTNLDLGRNPNGTYKIGEFVLCNGVSIETYDSNNYQGKRDVVIPNLQDKMYEYCKAYKLIERDLYLGNSNANPFEPITLSNETNMVDKGVYFVTKESLYEQERYRTHICDGVSVDSRLEHTYSFMPNYQTLNGNTVAILCGGEATMGDYLLIKNGRASSNYTLANGSAISIQSIPYRNPLISNLNIDKLEGPLVVKQESYNDPVVGTKLGKCVKIGNYIYTSGKARGDGWKLARVNADKGVTSAFEYAPIPTLNGFDLSKPYRIEISDFAICIEQDITSPTEDQQLALSLWSDGMSYASISSYFETEKGKHISESEIRSWFVNDKINQPTMYHFTQDFVNWESSRIVIYDSKWPVKQVGPTNWVSWGTKRMTSGEANYKDAYFVYKTSTNGSWQLDHDNIISSGVPSSNERGSYASISLIRYDGKGSAAFFGDGSLDYYSSSNMHTTYRYGARGYGRLGPTNFTKTGLVTRSEMMRFSGYSWTSDVSFRDTYCSYGTSWFNQTNDGWDEHTMEGIDPEYDWVANFNGQGDNGSDDWDYKTTETNTMNYKGSFSGVSCNRNVSTGTWYSNKYSDTGTETLHTPMTVAGFSGNNLVMQSNYRLANKSSNVGGVSVYVKLK